LKVHFRSYFFKKNPLIIDSKKALKRSVDIKMIMLLNRTGGQIRTDTVVSPAGF
jgi:hypothetical protein